MTAPAREPYAKRRDPKCRREWNRERTRRRRKASIDAGAYAPTPHTDYVALANAEVTRLTGVPRERFGPAEHQAVTLLLVEWARERDPDGPLKTYDPRWRKYEGVGR